jgi:ABC-type lipoprotein export system ATPase subunit
MRPNIEIDEKDKVEKTSKDLEQVERADTDITLETEAVPVDSISSELNDTTATIITQLENIHLQLKRGTLTVVVGKVGSVKSSLLHSIVGGQGTAARVCGYLWSIVIQSKDRIVILVTHQLLIASYAGHVVLMNDGEIQEQGSY